MNDLTPQGGWSAPVVQDEMLLVGNRDGNLVRFDPSTGNLDLDWRYPREDGLGAIYGSPVIVGDNVYDAGYTCRGDNCDGEIFAVSLADGFSIWGPTGLELNTKLVGQIAVIVSGAGCACMLVCRLSLKIPTHTRYRFSFFLNFVKSSISFS